MLDPGYTRFDRRALYVAYDVTRELRQGRNAVGAILFERSTNIVLRDITVTQTPGWAVTFFDSEHVQLHQVRLKDVMALIEQ